MRIKNKTLIIIAAFIILFAIKSIIGYNIGGPSIFPDETCIIQKSIHLSKNLSLESCSKIIGFPAGEPAPLYSIILFPIYLFFSGKTAFNLIILLNALLISCLIFPLSKLINSYTNKWRPSVISAFFLLLMPAITVYEKTLMTETLFIFIGIWFLYYYSKSFDNKKNKIIAVLFGLLAALTRPFGFILLMAMAINEIIINKNRKNVALIYFPLAIVIFSFIVINFFPSTFDVIMNKIQIIRNSGAEVSLKIVHALISQFNSFIIATYLAPIMLFFIYFREKDENFQKIKYMLLSLFILNFLISAQHLLGYAFEDIDPGFLTRYINLSVIFIFIYAIIGLQKIKNIKLDKVDWTFLGFILILLPFTSFSGVKHILNMDMSMFYDTTTSTLQNLVMIKDYSIWIFGSISLILLSLFILNKKKILLGSLFALMITGTVFMGYWSVNFTSNQSETEKLLQEKSEKILFLTPNFGKSSPISINFWKLLITSNNQINYLVLDGLTDLEHEYEVTPELQKIFSEYKYLVTPIKFNIPITKMNSHKGTGTIYNEYIYETI